MDDIDALQGFFDRSARTGFGVNHLNRLSEQRENAALMARFTQSAEALAVVFHGDHPLLRKQGDVLQSLMPRREALAFGPPRLEAFLGVGEGERPVFGILLDERAVTIADRPEDVPLGRFLADPRNVSIAGRPELQFRDLRGLAMQGALPPAELGVLAEAKALMFWHTSHGFCARCGVPSTVTAAGWRRDCAGCGAQHFPRTDPVVIMLAVDGERCLLGRQPRFPAGNYSCLAGFLESGETIEGAVRRELLEETGIQAGPVRYLASQAWPFPASLMIGCIARATTTDLVVDYTELEDARWFSRAEVLQILEGNHPHGIIMPSRMAIAHHIVRAWAQERLEA